MGLRSMICSMSGGKSGIEGSVDTSRARTRNVLVQDVIFVDYIVNELATGLIDDQDFPLDWLCVRRAWVEFDGSKTHLSACCVANGVEND